MISSVITSKGQTTLPKVVRESLGVVPGDRVRYVVLDSGEVRIIPNRPLSRLFGICQYNGISATIEDMNRAIADGAAGK